MAADPIENCPIKKDQRVKRKNIPGCSGTVQVVRTETTASTADISSRGLLVQVLWDNGTLSYFTPEALEAA